MRSSARSACSRAVRVADCASSTMIAAFVGHSVEGAVEVLREDAQEFLHLVERGRRRRW